MRVNVRVKPNSGCRSVRQKDGILVVNVDAPAHKGKANRRLVEILADFYQKPKSGIVIVKGIKGRNKTVNIEDK